MISTNIFYDGAYVVFIDPLSVLKYLQQIFSNGFPIRE